MASPSSPSPPQQTQPSALLLSSIFSTPSFSSTLPLQRPNSASGAYRRSSRLSNKRLSSQVQRRRTRSVASSVSAGSDGSLGDFSMENYTIDLAQLPPNERELGNGAQGDNPPNGVPNGDARKETDVDSGGGSDRGNILGDYTIDLGGLGEKPSSIMVEDREVERDE
ncbi:MAG: hypothetical protein Q9164_007848, partial [Protoblastenia rupestris]